MVPKFSRSSSDIVLNKLKNTGIKDIRNMSPTPSRRGKESINTWKSSPNRAMIPMATLMMNITAMTGIES